jgi:ubiquinone/menaquinone biosynthesis C-methylase UbiE
MPRPSTEAFDAEVERVRAIYDRRGARLVPGRSSRALGGAREWLASRARGETLEVGIGTGLTLRHYPRDVRVTGIDASPGMLAVARGEAAAIGREAILRVGNAMALDFPDESFDTVAFCLVLCSVPDDRLAIVEAVRVLRPGGRLVAVEHVRSPNAFVRLAERLWEPIAIRQTGDHMLRDPVDHLASAGLTIETLERGRFGVVERLVAVRG